MVERHDVAALRLGLEYPIQATAGWPAKAWLALEALTNRAHQDNTVTLAAAIAFAFIVDAAKVPVFRQLGITS